MKLLGITTGSRESSPSPSRPTCEISPRHADSVVEKSPKDRFSRFNRKLSSDSWRTSYLAFDNDTGREVAWNELSLKELTVQERRDLDVQLRLSRSLSHLNVLRFVSGWQKRADEKMVFITELATGGSLRQYVSRLSGPLKLRVVKNWCKQILDGLVYLHSIPVVHGDLRLGSIFECDGKILLGGVNFRKSSQSCDTFNDIFAFGLCLLEITLQDIPVEVNDALIKRVKDTGLREIISKCVLREASQRPSAAQLLKDPFWSEPSVGFAEMKQSLAIDVSLENSTGSPNSSSPKSIIKSILSPVSRITPKRNTNNIILQTIANDIGVELLKLKIFLSLK